MKVATILEAVSPLEMVELTDGKHQIRFAPCADFKIKEVSDFTVCNVYTKHYKNNGQDDSHLVIVVK